MTVTEREEERERERWQARNRRTCGREHPTLIRGRQPNIMCSIKKMGTGSIKSGKARMKGKVRGAQHK